MSKLKQQSKDKKSYSFVVDLPRGADGKRRQKMITVHGNKKQCEEQRLRILQEIRQGAYVETTTLTLAEFIERWLRDSVRGHTGTATYEQYEEDLRRYVLPRLGHRRLSEISPMMIDQLYSEMATSGRQDGQGLAPSTVKRVHRVLHRAFNVATRWRLLVLNPMDSVESPKGGAAPTEVYTREQVQVMLEKAKDYVVFLPCAVAVLTGMRRGEILAMRWEDVDLDGRVLHVRRSVEKTRQFGLRFKLPKNGKVRPVTLPTALVEALRYHQDLQEERKKVLGNAYQDNGLVFPNPDGTVRNPDRFSHSFRYFIRVAGLPYIKFHGLRHTHATMMLEANVPLKAASDRLGHSSVKITGDLYTHIVDETRRGVADRIDELIPSVL